MSLLQLLACAGPSKTPDTADTADSGVADPWVDEPQVCASPEVTVTASGDGYAVSTAHYQLEILGFDEEEATKLGALAETAWEGFASFFGAEVTGPLVVRIAADEAGFSAMLAEDGLTDLEGAGGYYDPNNGRAYLYRQPTAYYSRVLMLHELVHQYQDQTSYTSGLPFWYVEGLAEALSRHHWDGDCLQLRVRPLLSWEDLAAQAQNALDAGLDLSAVLIGASSGRPIAQELVRLLSGDPAFAPGFAAWRAEVAGGASATDPHVFEAHITDTPTLLAALEAFVPEDQEPMAPVYLDWIPEGSTAARGFAEYSSAARVKGEVTTFQMTTDWPADSANLGAVYGYDSATGDMELAFVDAGGNVSRFAIVGGAVTWDVLGAVSPAETVDWSHAAGADSTTVTIGGASVDLPRSLPPTGGLALYAAEAVYTGVSWE